MLLQEKTHVGRITEKLLPEISQQEIPLKAQLAYELERTSSCLSEEFLGFGHQNPPTALNTISKYFSKVA